MSAIYPDNDMGPHGEITKLECNMDDMTGEDIAFAMEQLFRAGAHEVYTQPVGMKKGRPGILLNVICLPEDADRMAALIMKYTTTIGVRRQDMRSYVLDRSVEKVSTVYGDLRLKKASGMGVERSKPEYEDVARLAREHDVSLETVRKELNK